MEIAIILVLSLCIPFLLYINYVRGNNLIKKDKQMEELRKENKRLISKLESAIEDNKEIMSIDPGDPAILPNYGLVYRDKDISFTVTYEVEIIEVSKNKVKVNANDFTSNDKVAKDPANRQGILDYMQDKWVSKNEMELIVDDSTRRDAKLKKLGIT